MASGRLIDYMGVGLRSARPAAPDLHTDTLGLYWATDEDVLYGWDGAAWAVAGAPRVTRGATWTMPQGGGALSAPAPSIALHFPQAATIKGVSILTLGGTGSCVVDIWKSDFAGFPPDSGDSICAAAKPTVSAGVKSEDTTLVGWTTAIDAGDTLILTLESVSTFTSVFLTLDLEM
jgi:hypothetical protein